MPVLISMLRGFNVGGHNKIKMDALRSLYESLKFTDCQTYAARLQSAIARKFGFSPDVILRTSAELRAAIATNPFAKRAGIDSSKLLVAFLASDPGAQARANLSAIKIAPEEVIFAGRELYIYFPNGIGRAKLSWPAIDRALKVPLTGRNWNTVTKLLEIGEKLEASQ
ncbi:MAG TPA: DUF1697 domain-containing protein [Candidatus Acidoferrales bacterium]|nr:DUF1697 domain-containing protein [Candidatus Acidoferrales bacterium]